MPAALLLSNAQAWARRDFLRLGSGMQHSGGDDRVHIGKVGLKTLVNRRSAHLKPAKRVIVNQPLSKNLRVNNEGQKRSQCMAGFYSLA